jgi:hypothetical protein
MACNARYVGRMRSSLSAAACVVACVLAGVGVGGCGGADQAPSRSAIELPIGGDPTPAQDEASVSGSSDGSVRGLFDQTFGRDRTSADAEASVNGSSGDPVGGLFDASQRIGRLTTRGSPSRTEPRPVPPEPLASRAPTLRQLPPLAVPPSPPGSPAQPVEEEGLAEPNNSDPTPLTESEPKRTEPPPLDDHPPPTPPTETSVTTTPETVP